MTIKRTLHVEKFIGSLPAKVTC